MSLTDEQDGRLQVLKDLSELPATKSIGGSAARPVTDLLMLADWVMRHELPELMPVPELEQVTLEELVEPDLQTPRIIVHSIEADGLPDMDALTGRVAFIFDGNIVSGWPLNDSQWEANSDVGRTIPFVGVTHWVEFPVPVWQLTK
jgi:hypothetical protein